MYCVVRVSPPPVPVMVIGYVPVVVFVAVVTLNVDVYVGLPDEGVNEHVDDGGHPELDNVTDLVGLCSNVTVTCVLALLPLTIEPLDGFTETEKSNPPAKTANANTLNTTDRIPILFIFPFIKYASPWLYPK